MMAPAAAGSACEVPMGFLRRLLAAGLGTAYVLAFLTGIGCGGGTGGFPAHEAVGTQLFESPQSDAIVLSPDGSRLYMALTTMGKVRVIDTATLSEVTTIEVGGGINCNRTWSSSISPPVVPPSGSSKP